MCSPNAGPDAQHQTGRAAFWGTKAIDPPTAEIVPCPTDPADPDAPGQNEPNTPSDQDKPADRGGPSNQDNTTQAEGQNGNKPLAQSGSVTAPVLIAAIAAIIIGGACALARRNRR